MFDERRWLGSDWRRVCQSCVLLLQDQQLRGKKNETGLSCVLQNAVIIITYLLQVQYYLSSATSGSFINNVTPQWNWGLKVFKLFRPSSLTCLTTANSAMPDKRLSSNWSWKTLSRSRTWTRAKFWPFRSKPHPGLSLPRSAGPLGSSQPQTRWSAATKLNSHPRVRNGV